MHHMEEAEVMCSTSAVAGAVAVLSTLVLGRLAWRRIAARSERRYQQWRERWH